jgi:hypothetical protein
VSRLRHQLRDMPKSELHELEAEIEEEFLRRQRNPEPEHVCGLQGFGREVTDVCPGCLNRSTSTRAKP